jgi:hypothetical protein
MTQEYQLLAAINMQGGINASAPPLSPAAVAALSDGSWNLIVGADGLTRPFKGLATQGANTGSRKMLPFGDTWGGIKDNGLVQGSGNFFQDIGRSRWGIGAGTPHIEGTSVSGFTLSTNLQLQTIVAGVAQTPVAAGLAQPSAPQIGIIDSAGLISNSMSAKIERTRPATGARSLASPTSATVQPAGNRIRITFGLAITGQTHWRVYFTLQGFGGTGIHYLVAYAGSADIPETVVAAGTVGGSAAQATGTLTVGTNPTDGETIVVNGVTFTFKTAPTGPTEILIGASTTETASNLATALTASVSASLIVASYSASTNIVTVTYDAFGSTGNSFTLANSSGTHVTRSAATLAGGVQGDYTRSLEFNFADGDLIPIEASYDDYVPPAATHAVRIDSVVALGGCYADSTAAPTSGSSGVAIAISKQNNYESYVPTHLCYLPEAIVDAMARPIDDYAYFAGLNGIYALQYVGDRGDELPPCSITTVLPDIGIQYSTNWCQFRGRLAIYTAQGNLLIMDDQGNWDADFAAPIAKILKGFAPSSTSLGYDPTNDCLVIGNGKRLMIGNLQTGDWRQVWIPDYSISGTVLSMATAKRNLYVSMTSGGSNTAYLFDSGTPTVGVSVVSNFQSSPSPAAVKDLYEMTLQTESGDSTSRLAVCIAKNRKKAVFRQISVGIGSATITDAETTFYAGMVGKQVLIFCPDIVNAGDQLFRGKVASYIGGSQVTITNMAGTPLNPAGSHTDLLMFVGEFTANSTYSDNPPNYFPNVPEARSFQVAVWLRGQNDLGNILSAELFGLAYPSSRAL